MAANALDLAGNSYEDFIDEFSSGLIYKESRKFFAPLLKRYQSGEDVSDVDEAFNEAMQSAIMTLQIGISMSATLAVNKFFYEKIIKIGGSLWAYIFYGKVLKAGRSISGQLRDRIKSKGWKGKSLGFGTKILKQFDGQESRIASAQIANDMSNQYSSNFVQQQKVDLMQKGRFENVSKTNPNKFLELFVYKTKTGTWKNTVADKRIFKKATGSDIRQGQSYSKIFEELNGFKEFASTSEGEIVNNAQAHLDHLTTFGVEKVR